MNATLISKIFKTKDVIIIKNNVDGIHIEQVKELNKCISRCPAVMFATNRTDRVIGRIKFLTISIKIITGIRNVGDPTGTK